jgi:hypothetical protein
MNFTTNAGRLMTFDHEKWVISENRICNIIGEENAHYLIENKYKQVVKIHISLISDNNLKIIDNQIELTESLYKIHFSDQIRNTANKRMNDLFDENKELIFSNRQIVISKAEYYLLRPGLLVSGGSFIGGSIYTLGAVFEAIENRTHVYFEKLEGFKKLHLISITGSPLSGRLSALFWSDETHQFVHSREINDNPALSLSLLSEFRKISNIPYEVDFADVAMEQLLNEIKGTS